MSDVFNVTAAWSKSSYTVGETITGTITGTNAHTTGEVTTTAGPVDIPTVATPSGAPGPVVNLPTINVVTPGVTTTEQVLIDTTRFVAIQGGRTWTVSADRKSISATA